MHAAFKKKYAYKMGLLQILCMNFILLSTVSPVLNFQDELAFLIQTSPLSRLLWHTDRRPSWCLWPSQCVLTGQFSRGKSKRRDLQ